MARTVSVVSNTTKSGAGFIVTSNRAAISAWLCEPVRMQGTALSTNSASTASSVKSERLYPGLWR